MFGGERFEDEPIELFIDNSIEKIGRKYSETDEIRYIDISSIDNTQGEIVRYTDYMVGNAPSRAQQVVRKGDILVSTVRPNLRNVAVIRDDYDNLVASTGFCVLRPSEQSRTEYLYAIVSTESFAGYLAGRAKGANYPAVNASDIKEFQIPKAPLPLQTRFAEFARAADKSKFVVREAAKTAAEAAMMIRPLFGAFEYTKTRYEQEERHDV
jgi:restriction endonuclease S subunit